MRRKLELSTNLISFTGPPLCHPLIYYDWISMFVFPLYLDIMKRSLSTTFRSTKVFTFTVDSPVSFLDDLLLFLPMELKELCEDLLEILFVSPLSSSSPVSSFSSIASFLTFQINNICLNFFQCSNWLKKMVFPEFVVTQIFWSV